MGLFSDTKKSISCNNEVFDRLYPNTAMPNELFICSGRSHLQIIESKGFNNIHIWYSGKNFNNLECRQFFGYSPCQTLVPIQIDAGEMWCARITFRWYPVLNSVYKILDILIGQKRIRSIPKN